MLKIQKESALNLPLEGSVGSFNIGAGRPDQNSIEVKYFLTHVGLDFSSGANEKVLSHLAPVREIFDYEELDFDEIMQRDIDDARVSGELIPYLLDSKTSDLVKLFPPIIVVVLPIEDQINKPASLYPKVSNEIIPATKEEHEKGILRSGEVGREVFQFEQPIVEGVAIKHDLVRFRINTHKTRLVIVDGQHRAMALLALYRNLKDEWSNAKRAPFKEYYEEWTPNFIRQFNLTEINLPVMLCTFPDLDEGYSGDLDLKKAARSIFLILNKTARKVSSSRNILLDDSDLISLFLRRCLSEVKKKDSRSKYSLRIFNVELDQFEDRLRIQSPIAITGVNHIYYLIEHLLLNKGNEDVNGAKPRSGKFYKRTDLINYLLMERLDGLNLLGEEAANSISRDNFTSEAGEILSKQFIDRYGNYIIKIFEKFDPYEIHNRAVLTLEARIETFEDQKLRPILFEGQGIGRVFEAHRENLRKKLQENAFETDVPRIEELSKRLDNTSERAYKALRNYKEDRAIKYLDGLSDKGKLRANEGGFHPKIVTFFNDLYDNVFTTVAFEAALICGFFGEIERANTIKNKSDTQGLAIDECFEEYIEQLNNFFLPKTTKKFERLVQLFAGKPEGELKEWKIALSRQTFRAVVYRGEMQPDQWPKYKYLLLEIWDPSDSVLKESVSKERVKCREQIFISLYDDYLRAYAREHMRHEDALEADEREEIFVQAYEAFQGFLRNIGWSASYIPTKKNLREALGGISDDAESIEEEGDHWESVEDA